MTTNPYGGYQPSLIEALARQRAAHIDRIATICKRYPDADLLDELAAALQGADIRIFDETGKEVAS